MPAAVTVVLALLVAFGCGAIVGVLWLHVRRQRAADEADMSEGGYAPRLLPSGLPATFDAPDHGRERAVAASACHFRSDGGIG